MRLSSLFIAIIMIACPVMETAHIVGIYTIDMKSHYFIAQNFLKELAKSGHNVTVFTGFQSSNLPPNYREVHVKLPSLDEFKKEMAKDGSLFNLLKFMNKFKDFTKNATKAVVFNDEMQFMIKNKVNVDVIITGFGESATLFGISKELNAPIIITSTQKLNTYLELYSGVFAHDSFVPNMFLSTSSSTNDKMSFVDRLINTLLNWFWRLFTRFTVWSQESFFKELYPNINDSLWDIISNSVQLILVNGHFSVDGPIPYMTNIIEVGGMQISDEINPLPESLKTFIDSSNEGIIYFCMGGTLKMKDLDADKKQSIINGLKKTKLPVVIKWEDDETINQLTPKEKFYASNWLPQNDILAHPKVKAYITHGGLLSTTEAIYHGVPIVGIPIFGDQRNNIKKYLDLGIAVEVNYETLSAESLVSKINKVIDNDTYAATTKELSLRFRDRPMTPVQTSKYWVEYVIRHKNQKFMKSPATKLTMIEYFNWDVHLTLVSIIILNFYITWKVSMCLMRKVWSKLKPKKNELKKKQN